MADQSVLVPMTLGNSLKGGTRGVIFLQRISVIALVPFDLEGPIVWGERLIDLHLKPCDAIDCRRLREMIRGNWSDGSIDYDQC